MEITLILLKIGNNMLFFQFLDIFSFSNISLNKLIKNTIVISHKHFNTSNKVLV